MSSFPCWAASSATLCQGEFSPFVLALHELPLPDGFVRTLCVHTLAYAVVCMLVVVRRPSGRVSECSRVRSAKKAEEAMVAISVLK